MKKPWEIAVNEELKADVRKKLKRLLKPIDSVSRYGPQKCLFCGTQTTWTTNDKPVCPACCVKYGLADPDRIPDPCEVCGQQGEWCTNVEPVHSLCYKHRDAWFGWDNPRLPYIDSKKEPEKWHQVWEEGFAEFVAFMKTNVS